MRRKERMDSELLLMWLGMNGGREPQGCTESCQKKMPAIPLGTDLAVTASLTS